MKALHASQLLEQLKGNAIVPDSSTSIPDSNSAIVPYTSKRRHSGQRRRRNRRRGDPNYPKPNRSGYNFFFAEKHYKLKSLYPNREREFTKMIGESWSNLSAEERMVYQNIGLKDKERYKRELKEYKEKMISQTMELGTTRDEVKLTIGDVDSAIPKEVGSRFEIREPVKAPEEEEEEEDDR
ncbi:hypothetical protein CMV_009350 [Castanea mollissima]|nr:hypothetical protein CMV_009350 [Castanea mollissima]